MDIFESNGEYYIVDVNPRFGGGYPHAYECGVNFPRLMLNNISGQANEDRIGDYEEDIIMMKYNEVKIIKG
jgi:carbamoyl-phosphate synthase large subunit